jgi:chromate transporter
MSDEQPLTTPKSAQATVWQIFTTFLRIGTFTIGGGYAMIPLIERDVVDKRRWIDREEFVELLALAQAAPGVIAMNIAVFVGYKTLGRKGLYAAMLGSILPSFLIILAIATVFTGFKENPGVESVFKGMRPAVAALIAVPLIRMVRTVKLNRKTVFIPLMAVLLIYFGHINPAWTILLAAAGGIVWSWLYKR